MNLPLQFNEIQAAIAILQAKRTFIVAGRGEGKSTQFGAKMHEIVQCLPGSTTAIAAKTYTHLLTSILPAAFAQLERMGYIRDIHYVIGKVPPKEWGNLPYHCPVKDFSNYISFYNPNRIAGFDLRSQERLGSGRGPNTDGVMTDETLRINKIRLDNELIPTIRANKDKFKHIPWHLFEFHSTSMPDTSESRWILAVGEYYLNEFGIDYFGLWRQVVKMQLELLDIEDPKEFAMQWNEIQHIRRLMKPLISKDGETLFILANAFDNIQNVGLSYIKEQKKRLPYLIFLIEIMNMILILNENCFYALNEDRHIYYDGYDDDMTQTMALANNFDFDKLKNRKSDLLSRKYYNPKKPIYIFFDWGGTLSLCIAAQFDKMQNTLYIIKEFYVQPGDDMPVLLMKSFAEFFEPHENRDLYFVRDSYGDNKSIQKNTTINQDAINALKANKWKVYPKKHRFKEPPMHEKWQWMQKIMNETDSKIFKIRIDGVNCKYLVIAMKDTKVKQIGNELRKDKSLERKENIDQREATHNTDALDKGCWFMKYGKENDDFYGT